ncbi:MBL fold metallo-hydrolase [Rubrobacter marinus]|uniref:MBL fold metallo-hydrolase n=1 Tax=Rubrobacter marinus TaxID=2653852 RepID=UPI001407243D|nr:MBL fold metallo-hydrolase [Rubrobacter marinus]
MKSLKVGGVEVVALTDVEGAFFGLGQIFPGVLSGQWERYLRRYPFAFADARTLYGRVGSYLLRLPSGRTVLVDAGIGPAAMGQGGSLMDELSAAGVEPEDVDTVFLTNLHGDHIGWALTPQGEPVFPGAWYVTQAVEWEASESYIGAALRPLDALGVLELLDGEEALSDQLTAIPTPGHTPGHSSLLVQDGGEGLVISGDVIAHPAQVTEPTWNIAFAMDKEATAYTREMFLEWVEADGLTVAAGHVPGTGFGRVGRDEDGRRAWVPLDETGDGDVPTEEVRHGGNAG